jgi:Ca2+/H+ antiporter, TMEM165/GDT1 family
VDLAAVVLTFGAIFVVELPDKTFIATLVLSTKFRPLLVWIGVALAFLAQTLVAVGLGKAASFLPDTVVHVAAALMFLIGAVILLREARTHDAAEGEEEEEFAAKAGEAQGLKVILTSFLVLFAAEWGDLSQLLTLSLVAKYDDPVSVFLGAWGALLAVSGLAVLVGRVLLARIKLSLLHYLGASVCLLMACLTVWEMTR